MTPAEFAAACNVPRGTLERIEAFRRLLEKWQRAVQLVAPSTLPDFWRRHALDSAQLWPLLAPDRPRAIVDLGSGAGFPGLILALVGEGLHVHLVESDTRKAAFLAEAVRLTAAPATVHPVRAESLSLQADAATARALAPLDRLLDLAAPLAPVGWFLKGARAEAEIAAAARRWTLDLARHKSASDPSGVILRVSARRRDDRS